MISFEEMAKEIGERDIELPMCEKTAKEQIAIYDRLLADGTIGTMIYEESVQRINRLTLDYDTLVAFSMAVQEQCQKC